MKRTSSWGLRHYVSMQMEPVVVQNRCRTCRKLLADLICLTRGRITLISARH